ncbi:MAG: hypothetical protein K8T10_01165 [Candidatus Eremiobacteraeota bacterium]|nr:hypothetical protein [Candidatus Eremiobacteraeota bacterium]
MDTPFQSGWLMGVKCFVFALLAVWLYFRVTKQDIFLLLAGALGLNGIFALIFFSGSKIHIIGIILNAIPFFAVLLIANGILCSKAFYEITRHGIFPADKMVDPDKGLQLYFSGIMAFILFFMAKFSMNDVFKHLVEKGGLKLDMAAYIIYFLLIAGIAYLTQYVIPWKETPDTFVTVGIKQEAVDVLSITGDVTLPEKIAVPTLFYLIFFLLPYLIKPANQKSDTDIVGLVIIAVLIGSVVWIELIKKGGNKDKDKSVKLG